MQEWWNEIIKEAHYLNTMDLGTAATSAKTYPFIFFVLGSIWYDMKFGFFSFICSIKGHDMVMDDYGDAESGHMAGGCQRCGFSFHHQMY